MMVYRMLFILSLALSAVTTWSADWSNLDPDRRIGGRMTSPGYLRGKIVVLDCRDYGVKTNFDAIRQLQTLWKTYKSKPFVVIGGHRGSQSRKRMEAIVERLGVTYPVYEGATADDIPADGSEGKVYLFDSAGRRIYAGTDVRRLAGIVGAAIVNARAPGSAKQWRLLLDYEIENLPGQALLRLRDLRANAEAKADLSAEELARYDEAFERLNERNEVKRLAKLVELAHLVKDRDPKASASQKITKAVIERNIAKYEALKESDDAYVAQEAKNALADLKIEAAVLDR